MQDVRECSQPIRRGSAQDEGQHGNTMQHQAGSGLRDKTPRTLQP